MLIINKTWNLILGDIDINNMYDTFTRWQNNEKKINFFPYKLTKLFGFLEIII